MFGCVCPLSSSWFCAGLVCKINSCCCCTLPAVVSRLPECDAECLQHLPLHSTTLTMLYYCVYCCGRLTGVKTFVHFKKKQKKLLGCSQCMQAMHGSSIATQFCPEAHFQDCRSTDRAKPKLSLARLGGRGCSSVGQSIGPSRRRGRFESPVREGIFLPESTFSADSLTVFVHLHVQSHAPTSVRTLKIP